MYFYPALFIFFLGFLYLWTLKVSSLSCNIRRILGQENCYTFEFLNWRKKTQWLFCCCLLITVLEIKTQNPVILPYETTLSACLCNCTWKAGYRAQMSAFAPPQALPLFSPSSICLLCVMLLPSSLQTLIPSWSSPNLSVREVFICPGSHWWCWPLIWGLLHLNMTFEHILHLNDSPNVSGIHLFFWRDCKFSGSRSYFIIFPIKLRLVNRIVPNSAFWIWTFNLISWGSRRYYFSGFTRSSEMYSLFYRDMSLLSTSHLDRPIIQPMYPVPFCGPGVMLDTRDIMVNNTNWQLSGERQAVGIGSNMCIITHCINAMNQRNKDFGDSDGWGFYIEWKDLPKEMILSWKNEKRTIGQRAQEGLVRLSEHHELSSWGRKWCGTSKEEKEAGRLQGGASGQWWEVSLETEPHPCLTL